jgi:pimeloyl-ACP methyl ester carboxylesterase
MGQELGRSVDVTEWFFPAVTPSYDAKHRHLTFFKTTGGTEVPAIILPAEDVEEVNASNAETKRHWHPAVCVIFFHPNACDVGHCVPELLRIQRHVFGGHAMVMAPEYPGYGLLCDFEPTVEGIDNVAVGAFRHCLRLGYEPHQVVLWGRSIGSGPAAFIAQKLAKEQLTSTGKAHALSTRRGSPPQPPFAALVLVAPFTSISAAVASHVGEMVASFVDAMWEVATLLETEALRVCPLCVVHPERDEVVPKAHGEEILHRAACEPKLGVWLKGERHNFHCTKQHLDPVRNFMERAVLEPARACARRRQSAGPRREPTPARARAGTEPVPSDEAADHMWLGCFSAGGPSAGSASRLSTVDVQQELTTREADVDETSRRFFAPQPHSKRMWHQGISSALLAWGGYGAPGKDAVPSRRCKDLAYGVAYGGLEASRGRTAGVRTPKTQHLSSSPVTEDAAMKAGDAIQQSLENAFVTSFLHKSKDAGALAPRPSGIRGPRMVSPGPQPSPQPPNAPPAATKGGSGDRMVPSVLHGRKLVDVTEYV